MMWDRIVEGVDPSGTIFRTVYRVKAGNSRPKLCKTSRIGEYNGHKINGGLAA
ncbi:MAG: hypothetical protein FD151_806 [bacterium]|nr:MAG: hypothetical protein FD151_806 [bacterium]